MNTRFYNGKILTMKNNMEVLEQELWVVGNKIEYIGDKKESNIKWNREIDLKGNLILPGFKNAHTHSAMTFLRSRADDLPLQEWLNNQVFPREAQLLPEDIYWLSRLAILEYLSSGITSNFDMYFHPREIAKASYDSGFRTVIVGALNDFTQSIEEIEEYYLELNNNEKYDDLISYKLGFHAEYTTSKNLLKGIVELSEKYKAPVWTHNSETLREVNDCINRNGMTPTAYLDSLGIYDNGGGGYHCVYLNEEDKKIFKEKNLTIVTNPSSNIKLASGIARIDKFLEMGIPIAIGTDGPASNNALDMFREMFLVSGLTKVKTQDASVVDGNDVLKMATTVGALAMGLNNCDVLEKGKVADLIVIDLNRPNMQPLNNVSKNIVYSGSKENIKMTMINGEILYENGEFNVGIEVEKIYEKANEITKRIR
ncbi:amidohydrolase [Miniphocaeibacter halophilus]|uniref:Amidohydrolase n=1 Tax=Miniphocaeibacter halophilus TaxID=2931922 RepID=A0AC61MW91_9FIRM|nr:amidohydrolase [Miniphocaeibacter halophilus]QQK07223.1 amidohydrolase [Miniphocaeibacter halophilus]